MEKYQLTNLLTQFSESSYNDAEAVTALCKKYPYSQVLHALAARTAKDHQVKDHQKQLQLAAVYSTDRSVLKELMTFTASQPVLETISKSENAKTISAKSGSVTKTDSIDYADEILNDLARLQELKHSFEMQFMTDSDQVIKKEIPSTANSTPPVKEKTPKKPKPKSPRKTTKRQRIIALAKELEQKNQEESNKESKRNEDSDPLIDEIKASKKEVQPENAKTKEQIEIIDQYIKSKPSIAPPKISAQENPDLASTLKSGEFGDNIISETLAEILIRQGKKDKAIEVYKKLIWKFPQKKTYFAAQIEELRK